jgi:hypothetical protein
MMKEATKGKGERKQEYKKTEQNRSKTGRLQN